MVHWKAFWEYSHIWFYDHCKSHCSNEEVNLNLKWIFRSGWLKTFKEYNWIKHITRTWPKSVLPISEPEIEGEKILNKILNLVAEKKLI